MAGSYKPALCVNTIRLLNCLQESLYRNLLPCTAALQLYINQRFVAADTVASYMCYIIQIKSSTHINLLLLFNIDNAIFVHSLVFGGKDSKQLCATGNTHHNFIICLMVWIFLSDYSKLIPGTTLN